MEKIRTASDKSAEKKTITRKLGDCCMTPDPASGFGVTLMSVLRPRLNINLLTRADAPRGVSIVASRDNESGWESTATTVDSGGCGTALPSEMLLSIRAESTEASRAGEEY